MLATLSILVAIHEFGHFWVARKCGVKVLRFSIGFGPLLCRWIDSKGTEFALSALPLGGYVKMLDEREESVAPEEKHLAFNNKNVQHRIAIVSAGPLANFILAIFVYWFVYLQGTVGLAPIVFSVTEESIAAKAGLMSGEEIISVDGVETLTVSAVAMQLIKRMGDDGEIKIQARKPHTDVAQIYNLSISKWLGNEEGNIDVFSTLGIGFYEPVIAPIIEEVLPDSAAEIAGLKNGDRLISADGIVISNWMAWVDYVRKKAGVKIDVVLLRQEHNIHTSIIPTLVDGPEGKIGQVGIRVSPPDTPEYLLVRKDYNVFSAWIPALERTWQTAIFSLQSLKKIVLGDISYKQLSGPISIAKVASQSANSGIYSYLILLALLSVSLGVLNLLPIPVLDGGHIFFYLIEWLKGSPVSDKIQQIGYQFGMFVVLSVMILALFNDLGRL